MAEEKKNIQETIYGDETIILIENTRPKDEVQYMPEMNVDAKNKRHIAAWAIAAIIVTLLVTIVGLLLGGHGNNAKTITSELPISNTAEKNTEILQEKEQTHVKPSITMTTDTINDVIFNLYTISGLSAELTFDPPQSTDPSLFLSINSADVRSDNGMVLCSCIIAGEQVSRGNSRSGYFAAVGENMVIGVADNDSVMEYARDNKGYFFRQFAIVSDGQIGDVRLKGKAPRSALGTKDGKLIYVKSCNRESVFDFAEALSDYGFTDALYIPADSYITCYRDSTGRWHDDNKETMVEENSGLKVPYLVFKTQKQKVNEAPFGTSLSF